MTKLKEVVATLGVAGVIGVGACGWHSRYLMCVDGAYPIGVDDTIYAAEYSHRAFCSVAIGDSADAVQQTLGDPLWIAWEYHDPNRRAKVTFERAGAEWNVVEGPAGLKGQAMPYVEARLGAPTVALWVYSKRGLLDTHSRVRRLHIADGRVVEKVGYYYWD